MSYNTFTDTDKLALLSNPGVFGYRPYGSSAAFTAAVFANGATYAKTTEVSTVQFDDVGDVMDQVSKETAEISVSTGRVLDLPFLSAISGGLYSYSTTAGSAVPSTVQNVLSGTWTFDNFILISGQNGDGSKQTIASVVGSVDGALVADTDYFQMKLPEVGWGIYVKDTTDVTTESQILTITYAHTPAATKVLATGGVKTITPLEIQFETIDSTGNAVTYVFHKCYPSGNLGHGFSPENSAEPATIDLTFVAKCDTSKAVGHQLYSVTITE
jgi:hypothetical protein